MASQTTPAPVSPVSPIEPSLPKPSETTTTQTTTKPASPVPVQDEPSHRLSHDITVYANVEDPDSSAAASIRSVDVAVVSDPHPENEKKQHHTAAEKANLACCGCFLGGIMAVFACFCLPCMCLARCMCGKQMDARAKRKKEEEERRSGGESGPTVQFASMTEGLRMQMEREEREREAMAAKGAVVTEQPGRRESMENVKREGGGAAPVAAAAVVKAEEERK